MFCRFFPDVIVDKVEDISIEELKAKGIKGLILDIDNTLAPWKGHPNESVLNWLKSAQRKGLKLCLASNNKRNRVEKVGKSLGIDAIFGALKPRKKAFVSAMHLMQLNYDEIAVIGDQIFTDIYGGNRLNMYTIFVKPIGMNDYLFVRMKRPFEDIILSKYREQDFETKDRRLMWKEDSARKILRKRI